jgi:hypothetical protein
MIRNVLHLSLYLGSLALVTSVAIISLPFLALKTADDSKYLEFALITSSRKSVLGASTTKEENQTSVCTPKLPIIGYINLKGEKLIVADLEKEQKPSACFKNLQEANENNYYFQVTSTN